MEKHLEKSFEEIKNGYFYDEENKEYECMICSKRFEEGGIYDVDSKLYEAFKAIEKHIQVEHKGLLKELLKFDKKHTSLTEKQSNMLRDIASGMNDKQIAEKNEISPATVRHNRFIFREKAKQAKLYLAIFENVEKELNIKHEDKLLKPHTGAKMVDERYVITNKEQEKFEKAYFQEGNQLVLKSMPSKEKRKIAVLRRIVKEFDEEKKYTELELNKILREINPDIATIRRYLIQYGFLEREKDCSSYWVKK